MMRVVKRRSDFRVIRGSFRAFPPESYQQTQPGAAPNCDQRRRARASENAAEPQLYEEQHVSDRDPNQVSGPPFDSVEHFVVLARARAGGVLGSSMRKQRNIVPMCHVNAK
jgi:hypothetical protein